MSREPIPTWFFVLVVVRSVDRFLLVQERKHGQLWYLPAGRVEPGERIFEAAHRETMEEAGIPIELTGVLKVQHTIVPAVGARVRVILTAIPRDDRPPKSVADEESLQAAWVSLEGLGQVRLRGQEVKEIIEAVASGAVVYPLSLLGEEG